MKKIINMVSKDGRPKITTEFATRYESCRETPQLVVYVERVEKIGNCHCLHIKRGNGNGLFCGPESTKYLVIGDGQERQYGERRDMLEDLTARFDSCKERPTLTVYVERKEKRGGFEYFHITAGKGNGFFCEPEIDANAA